MAKFNIVSDKTKATKALEKLLNKKDKDEEEVTYDPTKQAEGLKERIEGSGLEAETFTDKRNFVEKALNLTPNQNFLFDVFEIINRPQQAVFNAIKAGQEGKEVGKAMLEGLSGKAEDVYFKDILNNAGVTYDSGEAIGADDVVGFIGDIFLDPVDLAMIAAAPFTGGASVAVRWSQDAIDQIGNLRKAIDKAQGIIDAGGLSTKTLNRAKKLVTKKTQALRKLENNLGNFKELQKAAQNVLDVSKKGTKLEVSMAKKAYKQALKPLQVRKTPLEMAFRASKWSIGKGFQQTDNIILKISQKIDQQKIANGAVFEEGFDIVNKQFSSVAKYTNFKDKVKAIFAASQSVPKNLIKKIKGKGQLVEEQLLVLGDDVTLEVSELARATGKTETEVSEIIQDMIEYRSTPKMTFQSVLDNPKTTIGLDDKENFWNVIQKYLKTDDGFEVYTKEQFDEFFDVIDLGDDVTGYRIKPEAATEVQDQISKAVTKQNAEFRNVEKQIDKIMKRIDQARGVDNTTYDIANGKLMWSKADDTLKKQADEVIDADLIKADKAGGSMSTNESIRTAAKKQRTRIRKNLEKLKAEKEGIQGSIKILKNAGSDEQKIQFLRKKLKKKLTELKKEAARLEKVDNLVKNSDNAIRKLRDKRTGLLAPILFPDEYANKIDNLKKPYEDNLLEPEMLRENASSRFYSKDEIAMLEGYNADPQFLEASKRVEQKMRRQYEIVDDLLGTNFVSRGEAGYVRHAATAESQQIFNTTAQSIDPKLKGRTSSFAYREYNMSAREANRIWRERIDRSIDLATGAEKQRLLKYKGTKLFETEITKSVADFIGEASKISVVSKIYDDLALLGTFQDPELFQVQGPRAMRRSRQSVVSKKTLLKKLQDLKAYRGDSTNLDSAIKYIEENLKGAENFYMDNSLLELLGVAADPENGNIFLSIVNGLNDIFKKFSLATPGFHMRNIIGNYTNMYLGGVNMRKLNPYVQEAYETVRKGKGILEKVAREGEGALTAAEKIIFNDYQQFVKAGFHDIAYELYDLPKLAEKGAKKNKAAQAVNYVLQKNMDGNKYMDNMFRMSLLKYANDNPDVYLKAGLDTPEDFVRRVLFDPNDLTQTEKKWLRSMIPFYTFMKKNLAYQMKNVFENPNQYNKVNKAVKSAWSAIGTDRDEIEAYKKENFWIPILKKENGEYIAIKANLPIGDLGEFVSNPLQKIISSLTPGVRAPFEMVANTQTYTGLPIEQFQGQKGFKIPELGRKAEYALSQFGLLNPAGVIYDIVNPIARKEASGESVFNALGFTSTGSAAREQSNRAFQELEALRGAISYYKQQGKEIKTLEEIREEMSLNKTTTSQILLRLQNTLK